MAELRHIVTTTTQLYNSFGVSHEMSAEQFYNYLVTYDNKDHSVLTLPGQGHINGGKFISNNRNVRDAARCNAFPGSKGETGLKGQPGRDGMIGNSGVPG